MAGVAGIEPTITESKSVALTGLAIPLYFVEQVARIELVPTAWKAAVLPLNYTCMLPKYKLNLHLGLKGIKK